MVVHLGATRTGFEPFCRPAMNHGHEKNLFERVGCEVSSIVSNIAAHPFAQVGIILFCALWWTIGLPTDILTAALSILAITLTQMVLNRQNEREAEAHRRDVAMHAKLDELVLASRRARDEMAGIEELEEDEIEHLKEEAKDAIQAVEDDVATPKSARSPRTPSSRPGASSKIKESSKRQKTSAPRPARPSLPLAFTTAPC
jgi:low affinity Fe/Cu permease